MAGLTARLTAFAGLGLIALAGSATGQTGEPLTISPPPGYEEQPLVDDRLPIDIPSAAQTDDPTVLRGSSADQGPMDIGIEGPSQYEPIEVTGQRRDPMLPEVSAEPLDGDAAAAATVRGPLEAGGATVVLRGLDKITARVTVVQAPIGAPVTFGKLEITARYCHKRPPEETPEVAAFLEIKDLREQDAAKARVFSGWMFASSPALNAMQHAVYDVWVIDCKASTPESDFGAAPNEPAPKELDSKTIR